MKLLVESIDQIKYLREDNRNGSKDYYLQGTFLQGNLKNKNGRIYPTDVLKEEVAKYNQNYIQKNRAFGELNHPESPTINLDRVSHRIVALEQDGDNFVGKAKIMDTPMGKIVKTFMDEGCLLGVSTRGLGSLREQGDGTRIVQGDFMLTTAADIVSDPSAPEAFVENVMESIDWILDEKTKNWVPKYRDKVMKPALDNMRSIKGEEVALKLFEGFINRIGR